MYRMIIMGVMAAGLLASQTWADQHRPASGATHAAALPLSKIVLYTSGVGYFQCEGEVDGDQRLSLRFKTDDIKDLLKSLVVQDLDGGQVAAVTYDSRDPITKSLKSFAIDLTANPGMGALLQRAHLLVGGSLLRQLLQCLTGGFGRLKESLKSPVDPRQTQMS